MNKHNKIWLDINTREYSALRLNWPPMGIAVVADVKYSF